ncbi:MAG: ParA family protein [Lachnospiraceae bacterium]|nr:ParA family protein [Lachnospiraceae bacterium]
MKTIAFFNQKGGVGKTSITANIAGCMCYGYKKKVLVVDCDGQGNISTYLLTGTQERTKLNLTDYFKEPSVRAEEMINHVYIQRKNMFNQINIDVLPIDSRVQSVNISDVTLLKKLLVQVQDEYDYCLLDCPPHLSSVAINALCAADYVVVPAQADDDSLGGYGMLVDSVNQIRQSGYNVGVEIVGILLNELSQAAAFDKYIHALFKQGFNKLLFKTYIRPSSYVKQARHFGMPLCYFRPKAGITEDYMDVTRELINRVTIKSRS